MLENGGRIFTAAVGVVALVVAVIFVGHGLLTGPTTPSAVSDTSIAANAPPGEADSSAATGGPDHPPEGGGAPDSAPAPEPSTVPGPYGNGGAGGGGAGGGGGGGSGTATPEPYTDASTEVVTPNPVPVDVVLPQITGGDPAVTDTFNAAMRAALDDRIAEVRAGGRLTGSDGEVAHIGERVTSGVLLVTAEYEESAEDFADTVVVGIDSGDVLTLDEIFTDTADGLDRLVAVSRELGPSTDAGASFDLNAVSADPALFSRWLATPDGMRIYFAEGSVAPTYSDLVELTVPWDELSTVLDPDMHAVLTS